MGLLDTIKSWFGYGPQMLTVVSGGSGPAIDLSSACVAQYKMDDASGTTVVDSQGFSNGTSANPVTSVAGKIGGALSFNGTSDYVNTNAAFQSVLQNSFSVSAWARPSKSQNSSVIGYYTANPSAPLFYIGSLSTPAGSMEAEYKINGSSFFYTSSGPHTFGVSPYTAWYHLVIKAAKVSSSQATFSVFINNVQLGTDQTVNLAMGNYNGSNILIGNDSLTSPYLFSGDIDDVCIFNKALSTDEIAFLYNDGNGTQDLVSSSSGYTVGGRSRRR